MLSAGKASEQLGVGKKMRAVGLSLVRNALGLCREGPPAVIKDLPNWTSSLALGGGRKGLPRRRDYHSCSQSRTSLILPYLWISNRQFHSGVRKRSNTCYYDTLEIIDK